jgi:radical SAM superfamily enzyme YgiQ (UPF0313 family)
MAEIVLTADRTMKSDYHGREFLGFGATSPAVGVPEFIFSWLFFPKMKGLNGVAPQAPYGLRKIEAKLMEDGFDVVTIPPHSIGKYTDDMKVMLITGHDYLGLGPPSTTFASLLKKEPMNAVSFKRFMTSPDMRKAKKNGVRVIVGGPGTWQFKVRESYLEKFGIDCVVEGEAENVISNLVKRALEGEELPKFVNGDDYYPTVDEIPEIKNPSINGLVEIGRGCPKGCSFCSVTRKPIRWYPLEKIRREIEVNVRSGIKVGILHSDDVFLYGSKSFIPNENKIFDLISLASSHYSKLALSHVSLASVVYLKNLMPVLADTILSSQPFWGAEVGIETGSVRLAEIIMKNKARPFDVSRWPELVGEAFGIMHDCRMIPAATLIVGLPEETEEDILKTIELVENLRDYRSLIVPLFFVPLGLLKKNDWFLARDIREEHIELLKICLKHDMRWAKDITREYFDGMWYSPILKMGFKLFFRGVERLFRKYGIPVQ